MHRLGGVGLAALDRQTYAVKSFVALSSTLNDVQISSLHSKLAQFRTALLQFASDHRQEITKNPAFRLAFQQMCAQIGVDPLAGPRRGGWWVEMVGMSDWQYELGVQIVDICVNTRDRNGGLIEMGELLRLIRRLRGLGEAEGDTLTEDDIERSIGTLGPLGAGYEILQLGNGRKMVRSVVKQIDKDQTAILELASLSGGVVDEQGLIDRYAWSPSRASVALENLQLKEGLCWIDTQAGEKPVYWLPSVMQWEN